MRTFTLPLIAIGSLAASACGSSEPEGPLEQIIVREPGEADLSISANAGPTDADILALGEAAFSANCAVCHGVEAGAASGIGPNLHGIVGRAAASLDDFAYSDAMASSRIVWSASELSAYIANPAERLPGTSMAGVLVTSAEDRGSITAYLSQFSSQ